MSKYGPEKTKKLRIWTLFTYLSVFSPKAGKYGPEKIIHAVCQYRNYLLVRPRIVSLGPYPYDIRKTIKETMLLQDIS